MHFAGLVMVQVVSHGLSTRRPEIVPGSVHVGFVVDKVALGQVYTHVFICQHHCSWTSYSYHMWGVNSTPVCGRSSETYSPYGHEHEVLQLFRRYIFHVSFGLNYRLLLFAFRCLKSQL
jgi:hypothetical protein